MKAWIRGLPVWPSLVGLFALLALVSACGGQTDKSSDSLSAAHSGTSTDAVAGTEATSTPEPTPTPKPDVALHVSKPDRVVHQSTVRITGTATRGAKVKIRGSRITVKRGRFAHTVRLSSGGNAITVQASKHGMATANASMTVTRKLTAAEKAEIARRKAEAARRKADAKRFKAAAKIANYKNSAGSIPYNQLNKNANRYKGKIVKFTGQILQIQEDSDGGFMLLSVTDLGYGIYDDNVWVDYDHSIRSADGDVVTVYGKVSGSKSYETQIGGETYVPQIHARYIEE